MSPLISKINSQLGLSRNKPKVRGSGGLIRTIDGYTYHVFTSSQDFIAGVIDDLDYLIIAGGGSSSSPGGGGGGGAGGFVSGTTSIESGTFPIIIGNGGSTPSSNGGPSSAFNLSSTGGGAGGAKSLNGVPGNSGGSGGGGGGSSLPGFFNGSGSGGNGGSGTSEQGNSGASGGPALVRNTPFFLPQIYQNPGHDGGGGGAGQSGDGASGGVGKFSPPSFPVSHIGPLMPSSWVTLITNYGYSRGGNGATGWTGGPTIFVSSSSIPNSISNTGYGGHTPQNSGGSPGIIIIRYRS